MPRGRSRSRLARFLLSYTKAAYEAPLMNEDPVRIEICISLYVLLSCRLVLPITLAARVKSHKAESHKGCAWFIMSDVPWLVRVLFDFQKKYVMITMYFRESEVTADRYQTLHQLQSDCWTFLCETWWNERSAGVLKIRVVDLEIQKHIHRWET